MTQIIKLCCRRTFWVRYLLVHSFSVVAWTVNLRFLTSLLHRWI